MRDIPVKLVLEARKFLETVWPDWHTERGMPTPSPLSTNTCGRSSLFLQKLLRHHGYEAEFITGKCKGWVHCWVECSGVIIDITSDQFAGKAQVTICEVDNEQYTERGLDVADPQAIMWRNLSAAKALKQWLDMKSQLKVEVKQDGKWVEVNDKQFAEVLKEDYGLDIGSDDH